MAKRNGKLSAYAYAKRRGVDEKTVREAIAAGRITARRKGRSYLIDPAKADAQWARNTDLDQQARGSGNKRSGGAYFDEKTALARTQRLIAERKLAQQEGQLIDADEVERAIAEKQSRAVAMLMSLPEEIGPRIHAAARAANDPGKVIDLIESEIRRVCALIAGPKSTQ